MTQTTIMKSRNRVPKVLGNTLIESRVDSPWWCVILPMLAWTALILGSVLSPVEAMAGVPVITLQPTSTSGLAGGTVRLSATATSATPSLTYTWYKGAVGETTNPVSGAVTSAIAGGSSSTVVVTVGTSAISYWTRVTDAEEGTVNSVAVTVAPFGGLKFTQLASLALDGAEISAFDPTSKLMFTTSNVGLQIVNVANVQQPVRTGTINFTSSPYLLSSTDITSVAAFGGTVAVAVPHVTKQNAGSVVLFTISGGSLVHQKTVTVGVLPDHVCFTSDGKKVLTADEGEMLTDGTDPAMGTVSIIDLSSGVSDATVRTANFESFDSQAAALLAQGVRIFQDPTKTDGSLMKPSLDFEPEYIAISPDNRTAMVTLQEANAVAILDIENAQFTAVVPLGEKSFASLMADFSDKDSADAGFSTNLTTGNPVFGLYMPDGIAAYQANGQTYYVIANEGDDRNDFIKALVAGGSYQSLVGSGSYLTDETIRLGDSKFVLDAAAFPSAASLKANSKLGRLNVSHAPGLRGDTDGDGDVDKILMYGARSFSILDASGAIVYDSGDLIERAMALRGLPYFDDDRSDNKGPEPEGVAVGSIGGRSYAFVSLERSYGVIAFDITNPLSATYAGFATSAGTSATLRNSAGTAAPADVSPEGVLFVPADKSPNGTDLLVSSNEISNTLSLFSVSPTVLSQPTLTTAIVGGTAVLSVGTGVESSGLTFQWYVGNSGDTSKPISGGSSSSTVVTVGTASSSYWVRVSDLNGSVSDSTAASVTPVPEIYTSKNRDVLMPNRNPWPTSGVVVNNTKFTNLGLQGVGRISSGSVDSATGESLGSISDMQIESFSNLGNGVWSGTFSFLPDRGYNSGTTYSNYAARINRFAFTFRPYTAAGGTLAQNQMQMSFLGSSRFQYDHDGAPGTSPIYTTGLLATGTSQLYGTVVPVVSGSSTQSDGTFSNRITVDAEGLVLDPRPGREGSGWVSDEYGPSIYHFSADKVIDGVVKVPDALLPRTAAGTLSFVLDANKASGASGRRSNQGMEGLSVSPDGTRLFALMQSAAVQDANPTTNDQTSTATRLLVYDTTSSTAPSDPIAQYVIELPRFDATGSLTNGSTVAKTAAQSALLALSRTQFLILSRDGNGRGASGTPVFKSVLLADITKATNIDGSYDAAGNSVASNGVLKAEITPVAWSQALNMISGLGQTSSELEKFGMNLNTAPGDANTLSEKWEGLGLVSVKDPSFPNDYFLFVGNDNDFLTRSGKFMTESGTLSSYDAGLEGDTVVLAYRVRIESPADLLLYAGESSGGDPLQVARMSAGMFGTVGLGGSGSLTFTVANPGIFDLSSIAARIDGTDASSFSISTVPSELLPGGGDTKVVVKFNPLSSGVKTGTLRITAIASGTTKSADIPLVGEASTLVGFDFGPTTTSLDTPFLVPLDNGWDTEAVLTVGDSVPLTGGTTGQTYSMVGIPDGLGVYDNGNGTMTVLMNHELAPTVGAVRAHGAKGAFVSEWVIEKSTLKVVSGSDLIRNVYGWDSATQKSASTTSVVAFYRFCSADLPQVTAFYNPATGLGTQARIFMSGEEGGTSGLVLANVATGASKGNSYVLGKFNLNTNGSGGTAYGGWENLLANPLPQDKTVVIGTNDGGTGLMANAVVVYVGTKTNSGTDADRAGLTNGAISFVSVVGNPQEVVNPITRATEIRSGTRFQLSSSSSTAFSRPEDGAWNPINPREFFFVTTDRLDQVADGAGSQIGRTRLWRLTFDDLKNPAAGGVIDLLLEGGVGNDANMWDNLTVTADGKLVLQEDVGNAPHNSKVWFYDPVTGKLSKVLGHDRGRFGDIGLDAVSPFTQDEESSGVVDVTSLYTANPAYGNRYYLIAVQAHTTNFTGSSGNASEHVEQGQLVFVHQRAVQSGPSTTSTPYVIPADPSMNTSAVLTVGDTVPKTGSTSASYSLAGIIDGLGAYDNGDGTFTLLANHELSSTVGAVRAHGAKGAFVSEWIVRNDSLRVLSGSDLIQRVYGWDSTSQASSSGTMVVAFNRFCSADLPAVTAFYNSSSGLGSQARIFMSGEEGGSTGYAVANVATGSSKGSTYVLGKFNLATDGSGGNAVGGWENLLANPYQQDKTVVIATNDGGTGVMNNTVMVYVGTKTNAGSEVEKAGLMNGKIKFVSVSGNALEVTDSATRATSIQSGTRFSLNAASGTTFSRPEDGAWNPANPRQFYFVTTDQLNSAGLGLGTQVGRTRLWRLTFDDITNPDSGGTIDLLVEGGAGNDATMWDNITVAEDGRIFLQEDPGNTPHNAKIWVFNPLTRALTKVLQHDPDRFGSSQQQTSTAPFSVDEESSGIIEVTGIGVGIPKSGERVFLLANQAHYTNSNTDLVEGGQIVLVRQSAAVNQAEWVRPDLVVKTQREGFDSGNRVLKVEVSNVGTGPTDGSAVTVSLSVPLGMSAVSASGTGWTVSSATGGTVTATRSDVLWSGTSYPMLVVAVSVTDAVKALEPLPAKVSGGGDGNTLNNSFSEAPGTLTGVSSSHSPYMVPLNNGWQTTALLSVGDSVPLSGGSVGQVYRMVGIPDGLGAYDNGDGTITVLMNHELASNKGAVRLHGGSGAFVSEWVIEKETLRVRSGGDLMKKVYGWDTATQKSVSSSSVISFNRFCSADLPPVSAFFNPSSGLGSRERIFLNGEEGGDWGYAIGHVATGSAKGNSYILGKFNLSTNGSGVSAVGGWENLVANPFTQDKTVVAALNDGGTGVMNNTVMVYVGRKTNVGSEVDKAGLTNGTVQFVSVIGNPVEIVNTINRATDIVSGSRFQLSPTSGTVFSRPEDGAWNPLNPREFFFVTTDRLDQVADGVGTQVGRTRLWRLTFDDIQFPELGGSVDLLLEGGIGNDANMWDNLAVTGDGKLVLQEDPGNAPHNAKIWFFDPVTRSLSKVLSHDTGRFGDVTLAARTPFTQDEESSGVLDVSALFGSNVALGERVYLVAQQAHTTDLSGLANSAELVERGQLLLVRQIAADIGPSTTSTPYMLPLDNSVKATSVLTVGDSVLKTGSTTESYRMVGIPDGLGAYDNGDGSFTLLMNHELGSTLGTVRAHGAVGAFISEWVIRKNTLRVVSGSDLIRRVYGWDSANQRSQTTTSTIAFNRFCSANLPAVSAFYNPVTGMGTQNRIFLNGEEGGAAGYALAHVATGTSKGSTFVLGKFNLATNGSGVNAVGGWENLLASPFAQDKTVVIGNNDGGTGVMTNTVAVYVGRKTDVGTDVEKAGLMNGSLSFVSVAGNSKEISDTGTRATGISSGARFTLGSVGTTFSRPEDGAWNPLDPRQFYFVTTDQLDMKGLGLGTQVGRTRLWRLTFDDITRPEIGGVIDLLLEGGVGNDATMWDNLEVTGNGKLLLQEDPGNTAHNAKVWSFDPVTRELKKLLQHDPERFGSSVRPSALPFTVDEESSGLIDVTSLGVMSSGAGERVYLLVQQAHATSDDGELVERGQLLAVKHRIGVGEPDLVVSGAPKGVGSDGTSLYEIVVRNVGEVSTDGTPVEVTYTLPSGVSALGVSALGWTVSSGTGSIVKATRSDTLGAGESFPALVVSVSIAEGVALERTQVVGVSGGGEKRLQNSQFNDRSVTEAAYRMDVAVPLVVSEVDGAATVRVLRRGSALADASVVVSTVDGTARSGVDFTGGTFTANFVGTSTSATVSIPILNRSGTPQGSRGFGVALKQVPVGSTLEGAATRVTIGDAVVGGGSSAVGGSFAFSQTEITVSPQTPSGSAAVVPVVVQRLVSAAGTVQVTVRVSSDADLPSGKLRLNNTTDFTLPLNVATLSFAEGELTKTLSIPLKSDARAGAFVLSLEAPQNALLGSTKSVVVNIQSRDAVSPTLAVNYSAANSSGVVVATGSVSDSGAAASGVSRVEWSVSHAYHSGTVSTVSLSGGSFTQSVQLQPGSNTLKFTAYDSVGNLVTNSRVITWMDSSATQRTGTYDGLLAPPDRAGGGMVSNDTVGYVTVALNATGALSGQVRLGGFATSFKGVLDAQGMVVFSATKTRILAIEDKTDWDSYLGALSIRFDGSTCRATLLAEEGGGTLASSDLIKRVTAPASGLRGAKFNVAISASAGEGTPVSEFPQGFGFGSASIATRVGVVAWVGSLADGTSYAATGYLCAQTQDAPAQSALFYQSLYRNGGALATQLDFDLSQGTHPNSDVLGSNGVWVRPALKSSRSYKAGWEGGLDISTFGSRYVPARTGVLTLPGLSAGLTANAQVILEDGKLTSSRTLAGNFSGSDLFSNKSTDSSLSLSVQRPAGLFTGQFTHTDGSKTGMKGIILQKGANSGGFGYFLSNTPKSTSGFSESGSVWITPLK